jgi:hypothetical protein
MSGPDPWLCMIISFIILQMSSSNTRRRPSAPSNTSRDSTSRPSSRTSTSHTASRNTAPSCSSARRRSRRSTSRTTPCWCPCRRHATIPARRLGRGRWVLDERCVGREEGRINIGRGVLCGHVAIGVVFGVGRGESFGAGEGLWCWCLEGGVSVVLRTRLSLGVMCIILLESPHRRRSCSVRRGSLRSTR